LATILRIWSNYNRNSSKYNNCKRYKIGEMAQFPNTESAVRCGYDGTQTECFSFTNRLQNGCNWENGKAKPLTAASKYVMSSNRQAQKFDTRNGQERGEAFLRELEHALTFEGVQQPQINEVCNHPIWKQSMIENFAQYAPGVDIES
jgi:hypothetical protein